MAANADDVFDPDSPEYATASAATTPVSPGGTTVNNGIETVTTTATRLPNWKTMAVIAVIIVAIYITWRETRE